VVYSIISPGEVNYHYFLYILDGHRSSLFKKLNIWAETQREDNISLVIDGWLKIAAKLTPVTRVKSPKVRDDD